jgi:hypothetical protein
MARARGANAIMASAFETIYGTPPGSGYRKLPFVTSDIGEEQGLIASDLLGYGRAPQRPSRDVINDEGNIVVPVDLRNFGVWLKLLFGPPTTTQGVAAFGGFPFSGQPANNATISIGGQAWTFVTAGPVGSQSQIGATLRETLVNAVLGLNTSAVSALSAQSYVLNSAGNTIQITSDTIGTSGNSVALAASTSPASNATPSGATLSGGSASGPYNHVFEDGSLVLPSMALEIGMPDVPSYGLNFGVMANSLAIPMQRSGLLNATIALIAQGETRGGSSSAGSPSEFAIERFSQFTGQIRRAGVPLGDVVSGNFNFSNNLDKVEVIREDGRIAGADPAMVAVTGDAVVRFADTTLLDLATAGTAIELAFGWKIGAGKQLTFIVPTVDLPKPKLPITGPNGVQATFNWQGSENGSLGQTCIATLVNDVVSY